jgi:predicted methyltransferase
MLTDRLPPYGSVMHLTLPRRFRRFCVLTAVTSTTTCLPAALLVACGAEQGNAGTALALRTSARPAAAGSSSVPPLAPSRAAQAAPPVFPSPEPPSEKGARARWDEEEAAAELARWTPAMHAAARALADATYPSGAAAVAASLKGTHRVPGAADRDKYRHPAETMAFFGLAPTMTVLDVDPGTGWYTELLAPALAKQGRYLATGQYLPKAAGVVKYARSSWDKFASARFAAFLANAPELYGKVETISLDYGAPKLAIDSGTVDMVLMMREVHMMRNWGTLGTWLAETLRVLKPGGILGIVDHRAAPDTPAENCAKTGYLPEAWVIAQVQAAGFTLVASSEVNANPKDTKDHEQGVWTLPPDFTLGAKDYEKYAAIGESDRMTLKFVKPR